MSFKLRWHACPGWPGRSAPTVGGGVKRQAAGPGAGAAVAAAPARNALIMHWPLTAMHIAPWTNASTSIGLAAATARISSSESSRARITRSYPIAASWRAPSGVWMLIWVEAVQSQLRAIF